LVLKRFLQLEKQGIHQLIVVGQIAHTFIEVRSF